jgi:hypothetical protein
LPFPIRQPPPPHFLPSHVQHSIVLACPVLESVPIPTVACAPAEVTARRQALAPSFAAAFAAASFAPRVRWRERWRCGRPSRRACLPACFAWTVEVVSRCICFSTPHWCPVRVRRPLCLVWLALAASKISVCASFQGVSNSAAILLNCSFSAARTSFCITKMSRLEAALVMSAVGRMCRCCAGRESNLVFQHVDHHQLEE